jgi:signal transduction histidine kinase/ligand-binding sensor domain-containing protein
VLSVGLAVLARVRRALLGLAMGCLLTLCTSGIAVASELSLRQFDHTAWTLHDGAPSETFAVTQTTDGFLWLGTANGLFRFDGVHFELYQPAHGQQLPKVSVQSLLAMPDGGLWIGYTLGGASFLKSGAVENHENLLENRSGTIWSMAADADSSIWAATANGLVRISSGEWRDLDGYSGFDAAAAYHLFRDARGTLWVATEDVVYLLRRGSKTFIKTDFDAGPDATFAQSADGRLWVSTAHGVSALTEHDGKLDKPRYVAMVSDLDDLHVDDDGALWAISTQSGVTRIPAPDDVLKLPAASRASRLERFDSTHGLSSDRGIAAFKDREGNIWVATADGVDRFRIRALNPAPLPSTFGFFALSAADDGSLLIGTESDGLQRLTATGTEKVANVPIERIACLLKAPDGKLWLGGMAELGYLDHGKFVAVPLPDELQDRNRDMQAMTMGPQGDLWVQNVSTHPIMRLHGKQWTPVTRPPHAGPAVTMMADHQGRVWAGFMDNRLMLYDADKNLELGSAQGLAVGNVTALYESGQQVWVGGEKGLQVFQDDKPATAHFSGQEAIHGISGILRLEDGSLWLNSLPGVVQVPADEVEHFLRDPHYAMRYTLFNYLDGLSGKAPQLRPLPSITQTRDGRLWFATTNGAVSIDPRHIPKNRVVPPVSITEVRADEQSTEWISTVQLPKGTQNLEIDYTALSLSIPDRVRFRYRLDGFENDWQDADTRRQALYPHLPAGHYWFHVIASNNDGLWNETGAVLAIDLPPTFLQSLYFKALIVLLAIAALWAFYNIRLRRATAKTRARLYERFSERERIARDLHDTFFQGIQGLLLSVQSASRHLPAGDPTRKALEKTLLQSDQVMLQGRELVLDLRTQSTGINELGDDLKAAAAEFAPLCAAEFHLEIEGRPRALNSLVSDELYKLAREALNNAFRHARASRIDIQIRYLRNELALCVRDNGCGIDTKVLDQGGVTNHWGLPGMKERAAKIGADATILNRSEGGCEVHVRLSSRLAYRPERKLKNAR